MQVTKLRLTGFKSFVEPTELLIEPGLTGIVGPNGCGKSNLIDALRWVMGENSARGLRGGEMEDVIFAGTAARAPFDLAEVALHLEGVDGSQLGLGDVDQVELSRRIGRGAGSVFRVNGRELRARDVQLLFMDAASGARSATIVTQGQIGFLVEAKPAERRRLLEEAAGIGGLQARRHEAELKLRAAETNLIRVQDLLATLEEQARSLRRQARQAVRYRELSKACREIEAALLLGRWQQARAELAAAEQALAESRGRVDDQAERLAALRAERARTADALIALRARETETNAERARISQRLAAVQDEVTGLEVERARLLERQKQLAAELERSRAAIAEGEAAAERLVAEQQALLREREEAAAELEQAVQAEAGAAAAQQACETAYREALAGVAGIEARLEQIVQHLAQIERDRTALDEAGRIAEERRAALEAQPAAVPTVDQEAAQRALAEAEAAREVAELELEAARQRWQVASHALREADMALREQQERLRQAEEHMRRLSERRELLNRRRQELAGRHQRLAERLAELEEQIRDAMSRRAALAVTALEARLAEAEAAQANSGERLAEARAELDASTQRLEQATQTVRDRRGLVERLEAEIGALAELTQTVAGSPDPIVDQTEIREGYELALAAALGDDLTASLDPEAPSHWRAEIGAAPLNATALLPGNCPPLADFVTAPPSLARRLAQTGVVDPADAPRLQALLAPGQRLVSRDGGLWRWDGFVRRPDALDTATLRVQQQTRRRRLETELAAANDELARCEAAEAEAAHLREQLSGKVERLETQHATASTAYDAARDALAEARAADNAIAAEITALGDEQKRRRHELQELEAAEQALASEEQALAALRSTPEAIEELRRAVETAQQSHDKCTAEAQDTEAKLDEARARHLAARETLDEARRHMDENRAAAEAMLAARQRQERAWRELEAELARIATERARLEETATSAEMAHAQTEDELATARTRLAAQEQELDRRREQVTKAVAECARLRDRLASADARLAALRRELGTCSERVEAAGQEATALASRDAQIKTELPRLQDCLSALNQERTELETRLAALSQDQSELGEQLAAAEAAARAAQAALEEAESQGAATRESRARLEALLERAREDCARAAQAVRERVGHLPALPDEPPPTPEALSELEAELLRRTTARERLGPVNLRAIDEARELELRLDELRAEQAELSGAIERLRRAIAALNREGRERLRAAFGQVEEHFEALFVRLFGGGRARLALTDMEDPLAAGLELYASPPGKKLQQISLLSGGEKALTALALLFAVFLTRPAPLCVLDEVDAPLDDANVERLLALLEELAEGTRTRFLVITHHPLSMARMDRLYGVTMVERGISQLVSVDLRRAVELRATA